MMRVQDVQGPSILRCVTPNCSSVCDLGQAAPYGNLWIAEKMSAHAAVDSLSRWDSVTRGACKLAWRQNSLYHLEEMGSEF